ncbi:unnamed protein product [Caenorhabditis sp. 36 PRJEB53466]|nr:unnamed protein product [Caenorhabditis sp. 36 PRJEB53466]
MQNSRPIWQELPVHFKESVVDLLDLKSRVHLQVCSKADAMLVDNRPVFLKKVEINRFEICHPHAQMSDFQGNEYEEWDARRFFHWLHPKSHVEFMDIRIDGESVWRLMDSIKTPIKSENVSLIDVPKRSRFDEKKRAEDQTFGERRKSRAVKFDGKTLERLRLHSRIIEKMLEELAQTDQWKSARDVSIRTDRLHLEHFLHANTFEVHLKTLTSEGAQKRIENLKTKSVGCGFEVILPISSETSELLEKHKRSEPGEPQPISLPSKDIVLVLKFVMEQRLKMFHNIIPDVEKPKAIWQDMPLHFKRTLVDLLDVTSSFT